MALSNLSESTQDYLKTIWSLTEWSDELATTKAIAQRLGLRLSSVSDALKRLSQAGFISYTPYQPIELTDEGRSLAIAMVRRHRLIETFLVETLGYTWDQVHDEAEILEHAVSDLMIERIDSLLGYPTRDPHGDPIPTASGHLETSQAVTLWDLAQNSGVNSQIQVERICDDDPAFLRTLAQQGIVPGALLQFSELEQKTLSILIQNTEVKLKKQEAQFIFATLL